MSPVSRGFHGRRRPHQSRPESRRASTWSVVFPVLSAGPTPHTPLEQWSFRVDGAVDEPVSWTWEEFLALPAETPSRSTSTA